MDAPRVKRFSWRDESDRNIRAMDLTVMPGPERFPFDAHTAAQMTESEILKAQLQLETMAFGNLGRFRYALKQMIELERYMYRTRKAEYAWWSYARRVFEAAAEAGNPEAQAVMTLVELAQFAEKAAARWKRVEAARVRAQARTPELRKAAAHKAVITRKKNKVERGAAKAALSGADAAIDAVFRTAETLANAER